ncbi:glycosyltransferase family 4 protein [Empedobacter falsenii]
MKLIYIHQYFKFPDKRGGTRSYDLSKKFVQNNHDVIVITSTTQKIGKGWKIYRREDIEVHEIYVAYENNFSKFRRIISFVKFLFFSTLHLLKLKGDIVLATSTPLTIGIPALINKWITKTPYIFEVRDVWPEAVIAVGAIRNKFIQKILYKLEFIIYKYSSQIVPLSVDMQKSIVERYPQFKNKTNVVIENISEIDRFQNNNETINLKEILGFEPRFSILYAGTFGKVNGINQVIEWAELIYLIDPTICFILFGEGAEKNNVIDLAKEKGLLNKNVFILDSISKNELPKWYNSVSMGSSFVVEIKELWANSANKFFDTLAASKPILINHEGWQADIIRKNKMGYILPYKPTKLGAEEFVEFTKSKDIEIISQNALICAKNNFSLEIANEKYNKIINNVQKLPKTTF